MGSGRGNWTTYDVSEGVPTGSVGALFQHGAGVLWARSTSGLAKFDGGTWRTVVFFRREEAGSGGIYEDGVGGFWTVIGDSLHRFGVEQTDRVALPEEFLDRGKSPLAGQRWVPPLSVGPDGRIWAASPDGHLGTYDGSNWHVLKPDGDLPDTLHTAIQSGKYITTLAQDRQGKLWIGTWGGGVWRYDGRDWIHITTSEGLASDLVRDTYVDRQGRLWFISGNLSLRVKGGLTRLDPARGIGRDAWRVYSEANGLPSGSPYVIEVYQDHKGGIWVCTGKGVT